MASLLLESSGLPPLGGLALLNHRCQGGWDHTTSGMSTQLWGPYRGHSGYQGWVPPLWVGADQVRHIDVAGGVLSVPVHGARNLRGRITTYVVHEYFFFTWHIRHVKQKLM